MQLIAKKSRHKKRIHNEHYKWIKKKKVTAIVDDKNEKNNKIYYNYKNKINKSKKFQFREYIELQWESAFEVHLCSCCWDMLTFDEDNVYLNDYLSGEQKMKFIDDWSYIYSVFGVDAIGILAQCFNDPDINWSIKYRYDILRKISDTKIKLDRNIYTKSFNNYHKSQCLKWDKIIDNKLKYEIEENHCSQSSKLMNILCDQINCGPDIAVIITDYLPTMRKPQNYYYFDWMDESLPTFCGFINYFGDIDDEVKLKWTDDDEFCFWGDTYSGYPIYGIIKEFYCYRVWNYYDYDKYHDGTGTLAVFVGQLESIQSNNDGTTSSIYFYAKLQASITELIFSNDWSDLYLNGINSKFIKIECYQELYFVNQLYLHS